MEVIIRMENDIMHIKPLLNKLLDPSDGNKRYLAQEILTQLKSWFQFFVTFSIGGLYENHIL